MATGTKRRHAFDDDDDDDDADDLFVGLDVAGENLMHEPVGGSAQGGRTAAAAATEDDGEEDDDDDDEVEADEETTEPQAGTVAAEEAGPPNMASADAHAPAAAAGAAMDEATMPEWMRSANATFIEPKTPTAAKLGLDARLLGALQRMGVRRCFPVQASVVPIVLGAHGAVIRRVRLQPHVHTHAHVRAHAHNWRMRSVCT